MRSRRSSRIKRDIGRRAKTKWDKSVEMGERGRCVRRKGINGEVLLNGYIVIVISEAKETEIWG